MKILLTTIAAIFVSLIVLPEKAEARSHSIGHSYTYKSGAAACGCITYTKRVIRSFDRYNRPVYSYYSQPLVHSCGYSRPSYSNYYGASYYGNSYNRSYYGRSNYSRGSRYSTRGRGFASNNRHGRTRGRR